jgi:D-amino-acid dehydrogenase
MLLSGSIVSHAEKAAPGGGKNIAIVGAGIVGMSAALYLQRDGHSVTVFDPNEPGSGASYGNAGLICTDQSLPIVLPGILARIPKMLCDRYGPLVIRPAYLPHLALWLTRLALATRPQKIASTSGALGSLLDRAEEAYQPLLQLSESSDLVRKSGRMLVYSTEAGFKGSEPARAEWHRRGIHFTSLTPHEARELEPAIGPACKHALLVPGCSCVINPQLLVQRFAGAFARAGGRFVRQGVHRIERRSGQLEVTTDTGRYPVDVAVIAAGARSKSLCDSLGVSVPLDTERGYHLMFAPAALALNRPVLWADRYIHLVPMTTGIRLTSGIEFAGLDAPPDFRRIHRLARLAKEMFPTLDNTPVSEWLGFRPTLPDSLPAIGKLPGHQDVIACFGHQHLGLTLGPLSGRIVADLVAGRDPPVNLTPFRVPRSYIR